MSPARTPGALELVGILSDQADRAVERARAAEAKVARVQDVLDDAWISLSPDAEAALKEAIS
jgi:hypothetical protein